jgi:hypothetical protein
VLSRPGVLPGDAQQWLLSLPKLLRQLGKDHLDTTMDILQLVLQAVQRGVVLTPTQLQHLATKCAGMLCFPKTPGKACTFIKWPVSHQRVLLAVLSTIGHFPGSVLRGLASCAAMCSRDILGDVLRCPLLPLMFSVSSVAVCDKLDEQWTGFAEYLLTAAVRRDCCGGCDSNLSTVVTCESRAADPRTVVESVCLVLETMPYHDCVVKCLVANLPTLADKLGDEAAGVLAVLNSLHKYMSWVHSDGELFVSVASAARAVVACFGSKVAACSPDHRTVSGVLRAFPGTIDALFSAFATELASEDDRGDSLTRLRSLLAVSDLQAVFAGHHGLQSLLDIMSRIASSGGAVNMLAGTVVAQLRMLCGKQ